MLKCYAREKGASMRVDGWGTCTDLEPIEVPDDVAEELADAPELRIEGLKAKPRPKSVESKLSADELKTAQKDKES